MYSNILQASPRLGRTVEMDKTRYKEQGSRQLMHDPYSTTLTELISHTKKTEKISGGLITDSLIKQIDRRERKKSIRKIALT